MEQLIEHRIPEFFDRERRRLERLELPHELSASRLRVYAPALDTNVTHTPALAALPMIRIVEALLEILEIQARRSLFDHDITRTVFLSFCQTVAREQLSRFFGGSLHRSDKLYATVGAQLLDGARSAPIRIRCHDPSRSAPLERESFVARSSCFIAR